LVGNRAGVGRTCQVSERVEPLEVRPNRTAELLRGCRIATGVHAGAPRGVRVKGRQEGALGPEVTVHGRDRYSGLARNSRYRNGREASRRHAERGLENPFARLFFVLLSKPAVIFTTGAGDTSHIVNIGVVSTGSLTLICPVV